MQRNELELKEFKFGWADPWITEMGSEGSLDSALARRPEGRRLRVLPAVEAAGTRRALGTAATVGYGLFVSSGDGVFLSWVVFGEKFQAPGTW